MTFDKGSLRRVFDEDAGLYDRARPGYPDELFNDVVRFSEIPEAGRILEIGCGPGTATLPLARRGYRVLGIELGANLAAVAHCNLALYPNVRIITGDFEEWEVEAGAFDLVLSATAFHWIDPAIGYPKAARALRSGGALALLWNKKARCSADSGFFEASREVYQREAPELCREEGARLPEPHEVVTPAKAEIDATCLFGEVSVFRYPWEASYDAVGWIDLLSTYSDHRTLDPERRLRLFESLNKLIDAQFAGRITVGYCTILYLARLR